MAMATPGRAATLLRPPILLLAVVAGLVLGVLVDAARTGGPAAWLARRGLPPPYVPAGQRIAVGDQWLYLDCRGAGSPTVVLEAGSGSDSATWAAVHDDLAATTRTCAYDRPGRGRSDPVARHTLADAATTLRRLLAAAGETAPFVAVGHSLGGAYARLFAASARGEVVGVVLVDSFDPDLQSGWIHPLLGPLRAEYDRVLEALRRQVSAVDLLDWPASESQLRASSIAGLPLEVLMAPRSEPRLDRPANDQIAATWIAAFESLSPGRMRFTTAWGAGHYVHLERPDLVIAAVRALVVQARSGAPLQRRRAPAQHDLVHA
jgi:pimeloyl-ACP methyl ester carboxylesterase